MSQARRCCPSAPGVGTEVPLTLRVRTHGPVWPWTSEPRPPLGLGPALGAPLALLWGPNLLSVQALTGLSLQMSQVS